jgi:hypothetical protein
MPIAPRHGRARSRPSAEPSSTLPAGAISSYQGAPVFAAATSEAVVQVDLRTEDRFGMVLVGIGARGAEPVAYALLAPADVDDLRLQLTATKASALRLDGSSEADPGRLPV